MPLDPRIASAIAEVTKKAGQPEDLARRLSSWIQAIIEGNENISDRDGLQRRLSVIFDGVVVSSVEAGEETKE